MDKKYWIEKIEYPNADCVPYGEDSYDHKEFALQEFIDCINCLEDKTTCVALYEVEDELDYPYYCGGCDENFYEFETLNK